MKNIIFVTGNKNKFKEADVILGGVLMQRKYDLDEIQSLDLKKVVEHKVRQAYEIYHQPVAVEDVSLEVKGLDNLPWTMIRWFEKLLIDGSGRLDPKTKDRATTYKVGYGYFDGKQFQYFEGARKGSDSKRPLGKSDFGFDVIFIPNGQTKTYAQLGVDFKNKNSARYLALKKLEKFLQS